MLSERGDVVWSRSQTSPDIWWPSVLQPDLCKLALGAGAPWGIEHLLDQSSAPNIFQKDHVAMPSCSDSGCQSVLRSYSFYVCPGQHRPHELLHKCRGKTDFYSASWGCETTGDTYWKPSSSWDYIIARANYFHSPFVNRRPFKNPQYPEALPECKHTYSATRGWCNPLSVTFTETGKKASSWTQGYTWGLCLYKELYDEGITFSIKLLKEFPATPSTTIGPNTVLGGKHPPPLKSSALSPDHSFATSSLKPSPTPPVPTLVSSKDLVLTLINQTFLSLNSTTPELTAKCWLCYHTSPPFL